MQATFLILFTLFLFPFGSVAAIAKKSDQPVHTLKKSTKAVHPCAGYTTLLLPMHMTIGVKIDVDDPDIQWAFAQALSFWSQTLDMDWHLDNDPDTCAIRLGHMRPEDEHSTSPDMMTLAFTHVPQTPTFDGAIFYNDEADRPREVWVTVFVHELGHVFGLRHSEDFASVMYPNNDKAGKVLSPADLEIVSQYHTLRRALRQVRQYAGE